MFGIKSPPNLAGPGFLALNLLRVMNIIALLSVAVASWVMIVMNIKTGHFFFFDMVSHVITSVISIFLIISEADIFPKHFAKNWPKFSTNSGFFFLGSAMIVIGFNTLSNLNKEADSVDTLGLPLWRVVIASGIVVSLMGLFNIIATFVFSNSKKGITGRQVRSQGAAIPDEEVGKCDYSVRSNSFRSGNSNSVRNGNSVRSARGRGTSPSALPSYHQTAPESDRRSKFGFKLPIRFSHISKLVPVNQEQFNKWYARSQPVSADDPEGPHAIPDPVLPDRASPVSPNVQRPPTAMHPAYRPPYPGTYPHPPPQPLSSRYSVASGVTQF